MAFLVYCDNKGCGKEQEPVLDVASNEVFCSECDKTIKSVTEFAKKTMRTLGQIKRNVKKQQAFSVKCDSCQKENPPKVDKDNKIVCSFCDKELTNLPGPFKQVIKSFFRAQRKDQ